MAFRSRITLGLALTLTALPAAAADFSDPTWPCIQRKVEQLSPGLMWPAVIESVELEESVDAAVSDLADRLALRRVELDELGGVVENFAQAHQADTALMGQVFERVFTSLSSRRDRIIGGIEDFSLGQIALSEKIDGLRVEMDGLLAADDPDFDKVDQLEAQIDWDQTIYTDRQQSIAYLCETPVLLERRLYAISQMLFAAVQE